ncbi:hypothetical protein BGZ47_001288, partial [Haplosporangium gracile]
MAVSRTWVLKGSLWIQAVSLLVLTSILADTNAWIGAILTGVGLFLVVIGIIAAHKRRIGYLYFYVTLVGLWQILALTHILIICGLVTLPVNRIAPAFIVGQKIVENPFSPLKIVIPALYGFQWCTWCVILVCMVSLRLEKTDPTLGFEIQDPKQQRHSLNTRNNYASSLYPNINGSSHSGSNSNNQRMNQHLFNFRQSVIAPRGGALSPASSNSMSSGNGDASMDGHSITRMNKGKEPLDKGRFESDSEMPQLPERSWVGMERRASSDSNAIFIPNDPRISQVVVTFKDDGQDSQQEHTSRSMLISAPSKQQIPKATTIFITNHHYGQSNNIDGDKAVKHDGQPGSSQPVSAAAARGLGAAASRSDAYVLNLSASGESLSDMIFNSTQDPTAFPMAPLPTAKPVMIASPFSSGPVPSPQLPSTITGTSETAGFHPRNNDDAPNPARIRGTATKVSLTLSSDSFSSELSALSNVSSSDSDDVLEFAPINTTDSQIKPQQAEGSVLPQHGPDGVVAGLAMTSVDPLHIISKNQNQQQQQHETNSLSDPEKESHQSASSHVPSGGEDYSPQAQPNSLDSSHSLSSLSSSSTRSRNDDRSESGQVFGTTDSKPISTPSSSPASFQQPASISASTQAQASPPFNYTPSPFTPFPAGTGSVSVTSTTATATSSSSSAVSRTKSHRVSLPLQYWRNRTSQPASLPPSSSSQPAENATIPSSSSPVSPPPQSSSSFTQNYIANVFLSKKKKIQIPTIIIHADDEDGEPPRVLSPQDIEYLTTMPPVPLRPLIQPCDDIQEEGVYNDGYDDYDDYPHPHYQPHYYQQQQFQQYPVAVGAQSYDEDLVDNEKKEYSEREQTLMSMQSRIEEVHQQRIQLQQQQHHHQLRQHSQQKDLYNAKAVPLNLSKDGSWGSVELRDGPYVLNVPIDLDINRVDLEGLKRGD